MPSPLRTLWHHTWHTGAGVLFAAPAADGRREVLLGHRARGTHYEDILRRVGLTCGGDTWTLPGGGHDLDDPTLLDAALRETLEETWPDRFDPAAPVRAEFEAMVTAALGHAWRLPHQPPRHRLRVPLLTYATYLVELPHLPTANDWPVPNYEYGPGGLRWWPVDDLPPRVHFLAAGAIRGLGEG